MEIQSQNKQILAYLQEGNSITPIEALNLFGSFRLGARIYDLKKKGFEIQSELVFQGKKKFSKYFLGAKNG